MAANLEKPVRLDALDALAAQIDAHMARKTQLAATNERVTALEEAKTTLTDELNAVKESMPDAQSISDATDYATREDVVEVLSQYFPAEESADNPAEGA